MTTAPRSTADTSLRLPPNVPIGVRHALTMTDSASFGIPSILPPAFSTAATPPTLPPSSCKIARMATGAFEFGGEIAWRPSPERHRAQPPDGVHAPARTARLPGTAGSFHGRSRVVLARRLRRSRHRVLRTVHAGPGPVAGTRLGAVVRRRPPEHRPQLPRQMGGHARPTRGPRSGGKARKARTARSPTPSCAPRRNRCANALRALGVGKGDRVALFLPMGPELVAAFFADRQDRRGGAAALLRLRGRCGGRAAAGRRGDASSSRPTASGAAASASR